LRVRVDAHPPRPVRGPAPDAGTLEGVQDVRDESGREGIRPRLPSGGTDPD